MFVKVPYQYLLVRLCEELSHLRLFSYGKLGIQIRRQIAFLPTKYFSRPLLSLISPAMFLNFQNCIFGGFSGVKVQKMTLNYQFQSFMLFISGTVDHIMEIFGTQV